MDTLESFKRWISEQAINKDSYLECANLYTTLKMIERYMKYIEEKQQE